MIILYTSFEPGLMAAEARCSVASLFARGDKRGLVLGVLAHPVLLLRQPRYGTPFCCICSRLFPGDTLWATRYTSTVMCVAGMHLAVQHVCCDLEDVKRMPEQCSHVSACYRYPLGRIQ